MCEWCKKHGAGGKWYFNAQNYTHQLAEEIGAEEYLTVLWKNFENIYIQNHYGISSRGLTYKLQIPLFGRMLRWYIERNIHKETHLNPHHGDGHFGQVIPVEEALIIAGLAEEQGGGIARVKCVCRKMNRNIDDFSCLVFGVLGEVATKIPRFIPETGAERLDVDQAYSFIKKMNQRGRIHTVWFEPIPFIGSLCACDYPTCTGLKMRRDFGFHAVHKAEYVALIDVDQCVGCKTCVSRCQFGALTFSDSLGKAYISQSRCFGCGLCKDICPEDAITLISREELPGLKGDY